MKTFLEELAAQILERHQQHLDKLCVVLPNKRAGLYLKKFIAQQAGKTVWAPRVLSIEALVAELSGLEFGNHLTLMTELFRVHQQLKTDKAGDFTEFLSWGSTLIKDFNDTDHYLADARQLFSYLDASRAMTLWNPDGRPLTEFQLDYLDFYQSLFDYYLRFREQLLQKKLAYSGMAFRMVSENPEPIFSNDQRFYIFAGFNALTSAEESIIRFLMQAGKAEVIWDADAYYSNNTNQEAGIFLRKHQEQWKLKDLNITTNAFAEKSASLEIIGVAGQVGQAKVCGELLSRMSKEEIAESCVVLADESLLIPVLNAIPKGIDTFNITMGFPLELSALHQLIVALFNMQEASQRFRGIRGSSEQMVFYKDLHEIVAHPYIAQWMSGSGQNAATAYGSRLATHFLKQQQFFIPIASLLHEAEQLSAETKVQCNLLFSDWAEQDGGALSALNELLSQLLDFFASKNESRLECEYIYQYKCLVQSAISLLSEYSLNPDLSGFQAILKLFSQSASIPFYGEPLSGFQLMGVLETRNLDFKNIIMLSVNDDILPGGKLQQSYLPNDIRSDFGLPTYKDKEAVYAYHFYRLLQRSTQVRLIYNTEPGPMGGGEKSRFIAQLLHELPPYNPSIKITEHIFSLPPLRNLPDTKIVIQKSAEVLALLEKKASSGFSPSSINAYAACSLKFYFGEVLGIREKESVEESLDAAMLGQAIHEVLHRLYKPWVGKSIVAIELKKRSADVESLCNEVFQEMMHGSDFRFGKNLLLYKVALTYISNFLQAEIKQLEDPENSGNSLQMVQLEEELSVSYAPGEIAPCTTVMKGFADRIDRLGDITRIIDYKTGKVEDKELKLSDLTTFFTENHSDKAFQLLFYAYLYFKQHKDFNNEITSAIVSFRLLNRGLLPIVLNEQSALSRKDADSFEEVLKQWLQELFNTSLCFEQTEDRERCKFCDYRELCYR